MKIPMLKPCTCDKWLEFMPILISQQQIASSHSFIPEFPMEGVFIYCPWCGEERKNANLERHRYGSGSRQM